LFFSQQKQQSFESSLYSIYELLLLTAGRLAQRPPALPPATQLAAS
jgi:hypothetical protein